MKTIKFAFIALATLTPLTGCASPSATIKVCVVDDVDKPISGVASELINIYDYGETRTGLTDKNGFYSDYIKNIYEVSGYFEKAGYYKSKGVIWEAPTKWGDVPVANTNFVIGMRHIINPVPMTYRHIRTYFPRNDESVGFDLAMGDWVAPDGKGQQADIYFNGSLRFESRRDFDLNVNLKFNDLFGGIQEFYNLKTEDKKKLGSEFIAPYTAPEVNYEQMYSLWKTSGGNPAKIQQHNKAGRNYIFRTRVVVNEKDEIIMANYGWTVGEIVIDPSNKDKIFLTFSYYYNPDPHSRSLEPKEIADRQMKDLKERDQQ